MSTLQAKHTDTQTPMKVIFPLVNIRVIPHLKYLLAREKIKHDATTLARSRSLKRTKKSVPSIIDYSEVRQKPHIKKPSPAPIQKKKGSWASAPGLIHKTDTSLYETDPPPPLVRSPFWSKKMKKVTKDFNAFHHVHTRSMESFLLLLGKN